MSEHKPGSMDIHEQEKTFDGFIKLGKWVTGISILIVVYLAIYHT